MSKYSFSFITSITNAISNDGATPHGTGLLCVQWKIDPESLTAKKISSDTYDGKSQAELSGEIRNAGNGGYLIWIDGVQLSPGGEYVVYRTNRDCRSDRIESASDTSVWTIDLKTGEEHQVIVPAYHNDIVGFLSGRHVVVGALADTRIVDMITGTVVSVSFQQLPNFYICGVNDGTIVYSSYADGTSETSAYISRIDTSTGAMTLITKVVGYLGGAEPRFSPSGKTVAIGYGTKPMVGVVDIMLVNLATGTQKLLTASVEGANQIEGEITKCQWAYNDTLIVTAQNGNEWRTYIIAFGG